MSKKEFVDKIKHGMSREEMIDWMRNGWDGFMPLDLSADIAKELAGRSNDELISESDAIKITNDFIGKDFRDYLEGVSTDTLADWIDRLRSDKS